MLFFFYWKQSPPDIVGAAIVTRKDGQLVRLTQNCYQFSRCETSYVVSKCQAACTTFLWPSWIQYSQLDLQQALNDSRKRIGLNKFAEKMLVRNNKNRIMKHVSKKHKIQNEINQSFNFVQKSSALHSCLQCYGLCLRSFTLHNISVFWRHVMYNSNCNCTHVIYPRTFILFFKEKVIVISQESSALCPSDRIVKNSRC